MARTVKGTFEGTVEYGLGQFADRGFGPSANIAIRLDDANAALHKQGDDGLVRLWAKEGTGQAAVYSALSRGDRVTVGMDERGNLFMMDGAQASGASPTPRPSQPRPQRPSNRKDVYHPIELKQIEQFCLVASNKLEMFLPVLALVREQMGDAPLDVAVQVADIIYKSAWVSWNPDMRVEIVVTEEDAETLFVDGVNPKDLVGSVIEGILAHTPFENQQQVIGTLRMMGLSSEDLDAENPDTWLHLFRVARDFATLRNGGMTEDEVVGIVSEKHGIKMASTIPF